MRVEVHPFRRLQYTIAHAEVQAKTSTVHIYQLTDPRTGVCRYIGQTRDPDDRARCHLDPASQTNLQIREWVDELRQLGHEPVLHLLDACEEWRACEVEDQWMERMRSEGARLLNLRQRSSVTGKQFIVKDGRSVRREPESIRDIATPTRETIIRRLHEGARVEDVAAEHAVTEDQVLEIRFLYRDKELGSQGCTEG